jgi:hypothetical protein
MTWIDRDRILDLIGWEFYQFHMIFLIVGVISELNNLMTWIDSDRILDLVGWEFSCRGWEFSYRCCIDNEIPVHENLSTHNKIFYFCRFCLLVYFSCYPLSISPTGKLISYLSIFGVSYQFDTNRRFQFPGVAARHAQGATEAGATCMERHGASADGCTCHGCMYVVSVPPWSWVGPCLVTKLWSQNQ